MCQWMRATPNYSFNKEKTNHLQTFYMETCTPVQDDMVDNVKEGLLVNEVQMRWLLVVLTVSSLV